MAYMDDVNDVYWDVVGLMIVHYGSPEWMFDQECLRIADRIGETDPYRSKWIRKMVEDRAIPSREWEDALFDGTMEGA